MDGEVARDRPRTHRFTRISPGMEMNAINSGQKTVLKHTKQSQLSTAYPLCSLPDGASGIDPQTRRLAADDSEAGGIGEYE